MQSVIASCAAASALVAGAVAGWHMGERLERVTRRKALRTGLDIASALEASSATLECEGMSARIVSYAADLSRRATAPVRFAGSREPGFGRLEEAVTKAGLEEALTPCGCERARMHLALVGGICGALVGGLVSGMLAFVGLVAGAVVGWRALSHALRDEARARCFVAERQLSQMIEVVSLGLRSGMSFDRALALYCQRFEGSLASALSLAQGQWSHGLIERSEGLRRVARTYDSPLFARLAENVIRSLRFGTSLADGLSALAVEARAVRKAKLEEKVAKAPVKMLLPVGTLILPAMLVLILGPVMLDLMEGV